MKVIRMSAVRAPESKRPGAVSDHVEAIPDKGHLFQRFLERRMR